MPNMPLNPTTFMVISTGRSERTGAVRFLVSFRSGQLGGMYASTQSYTKSPLLAYGTDAFLCGRVRIHHARSNKLEEQALASSVVREFQLATSAGSTSVTIYDIYNTPYQQAMAGIDSTAILNLVYT